MPCQLTESGYATAEPKQAKDTLFGLRWEKIWSEWYKSTKLFRIIIPSKPGYYNDVASPHNICNPLDSFDLRCESVTYLEYHIDIASYVAIVTKST